MSSLMPLIHDELIRLADLESGLNLSGTPVAILDSGQAWHPKLTPYRLLSILLPACLGTIKAVALQQGKQNEPITLEWISGVVVFIVLFNTGTYERSPIQHVPGYLAWLFKYDCMDAVWWLCVRHELTRPHYISNEVEVEEHGTIYMVTSYRLLVCGTVVSIGMLKAGLTYSGISTAATWIEWVLGVLITSVLYIIGLYESNTIGLWASFFGTNRAYVVRTGVRGTFHILGILFNYMWMAMLLSFRRGTTHQYVVEYPTTQEPLVPTYQHDSFWLPIYALCMVAFFAAAFVLFAQLTYMWLDLCNPDSDHVPLGPFVVFGVMRRYLGSHIRVPLRIRIFVLWIASFPSYAYTPRTSSRSRSFLSALARLCATILSLIWTLRPLLCFLGASTLIIHENLVLSAPGYQMAQEGELSEDALLFFQDFLLIFVFGTHNNLSTLIPSLAAIVAMSSLWEMIASVPKIKRRAERGAVRAVTGLSGLSRVDEVHYSFQELVWTLHGDAVGAPTSARPPLQDARDVNGLGGVMARAMARARADQPNCPKTRFP